MKYYLSLVLSVHPHNTSVSYHSFQNKSQSSSTPLTETLWMREIIISQFKFITHFYKKSELECVSDSSPIHH